MTCLFSSYLCLQETSAQTEITDKVEKLVPCTFVRETQDEIAQISVLADLESRYIEELAPVVS